jgi:hypothetical protein
MCASCRILHDPIWFRYLLLVGYIHQFWVAALVLESTYAWLWQLDLIEILPRFPYVHTDSYIVSTILQSVRWWIFRVGIPHTMWRICCSQYAHSFVMQTGIPVCRYFSDPCQYAYGDPRMHTLISVSIILHMGIQDLISHMETISSCIRGSPYENVPAICKRTRVYTKNHLENHWTLLNYCIWGSRYAYRRGTGVHVAKVSTKFANGDPCMHTSKERVYMRQKLVRNLQIVIPVCVMKLCAERLLTHHKLIPVRIQGLPVCVRGGRPEISHMGSPRLHNEIVRILGATYMLLPICAQFRYANGDPHMRIF